MSSCFFVVYLIVKFEKYPKFYVRMGPGNYLK